MRRRLRLFRHLDESQAVENGHDQIGDDDARQQGAGELEGFDAVRRLVNLAAAESLQHRSDQPAGEWLIVADKKTYQRKIQRKRCAADRRTHDLELMTLKL